MNDEIIAALKKEGIEISSTGPTLSVEIENFPEGEHLEQDDIETVFREYGEVLNVEIDPKNPGKA